MKGKGVSYFQLPPTALLLPLKYGIKEIRLAP